MDVCVVEGFLEGSLTSRRLRTELKRKGYHIVDNPTDASAIIAHSSGWVLLPELTNNQRLILVDPAYPTNKSVTSRQISRIKYDLSHFQLGMLYQRLLNVVYLIIKLPLWLDLNRKFASSDVTPLFKRVNTTVCRVGDSTWWSDSFLYDSPATIVYIGGDHDAFWRHPGHFIERVDSLEH